MVRHFRPFDLMLLVLAVITVQARSGQKKRGAWRSREAEIYSIRNGHMRDIVRCPDFLCDDLR